MASWFWTLSNLRRGTWNLQSSNSKFNFFLLVIDSTLVCWLSFLRVPIFDSQHRTVGAKIWEECGRVVWSFYHQPSIRVRCSLCSCAWCWCGLLMTALHRELVADHKPGSLRLYASSDGCLYLDQIQALCQPGISLSLSLSLSLSYVFIIISIRFRRERKRKQRRKRKGEWGRMEAPVDTHPTAVGVGHPKPGLYTRGEGSVSISTESRHHRWPPSIFAVFCRIPRYYPFGPPPPNQQLSLTHI